MRFYHLVAMSTLLIFLRARAFTIPKVPRQCGLRSRVVSTTRSFSSASSYELCLSLPTVDDMNEISALISYLSSPPDVIFLDGDLGAGKTTFSSGFVKFKLGITENNGKDEIRVTSPTYLLCNTYMYRDELERLQEIRHMDLYRLPGTSVSDFDALELDLAFQKCISLVEWPSRLAAFKNLMPPVKNKLDIHIAVLPESQRRLMTIATADGSTWKERLEDLVDQGLLDDLIR